MAYIFTLQAGLLHAAGFIFLARFLPGGHLFDLSGQDLELKASRFFFFLRVLHHSAVHGCSCIIPPGQPMGSRVFPFLIFRRYFPRSNRILETESLF